MGNQTDPIATFCQENTESDECRTCSGSNCNSERTFAMCLHCDSAKDPQCAINPIAAKRKVCRAYHDGCYTLIGKFNVTRGCVKEERDDFQENVCNNLKKCAICSGRNCNGRAVDMESCVECKSSKDVNCNDNLDAFKGKICSEIDSFGREGCFLESVSMQSITIE